MKSKHSHIGFVVPAGKFKAQCLQIMDEVAESHQEITITKHGKAVVKLVPVQEESVPLFGFMRGSAHIKGDIVAPLDVSWEAAD